MREPSNPPLPDHEPEAGTSPPAERLFLLERALAQGLIGLFGGAYFTGFALALGAANYHIGLLGSARFLGGFGQILTDPLLRRIGSRKRYCLLLMGLSRLVRVGVLLVPWTLTLHLSREAVIGLLILIVLTMNTASSSAGIVLLGWMTEVVPRERRGRFLSNRNLVMGLAKFPIAFLAAYCLDRARSPGAAHPPLLAFQGVFGVGLVFGVLSLLVLLRVPQWQPPAPADGASFWKRVQHPVRSRRFRPYLLYRMAWIFAAGFAADFFDVYLLSFLGMPYLWVTAANGVGEAVSLLAARHWGRWVDRFGARPVLILATLMKAIFPLAWTLVMPGWWWLIFVPMLLRAFNSASQTATLHLSLHLPPPDEREGFMAVERSLTHPVRALAPLLAGVLARVLGDARWQWGAFRFEALHLLFIISGILRLCSAWLLLRVEEPGARSLRELARRALRRRRTAAP